jgi:SPP1 family predicted phage head-tail adaptor
MNIGKLDRWITIQSEVDTQDTDGSYTKTWTTFKQVWASKVDKSGNEGLEQARDTATTSTIFKIRYLSKLTQKHRISFNGTTYDIEIIKELGRREGQELTCVNKYGNTN